MATGKSRIEELEEKKNQITAKIKRLKDKEKMQVRKLDARRKIIYGSVAMKLAEMDKSFESKMAELLRKNVKREDLEKLFPEFGHPPKADSLQGFEPDIDLF